jgi:hypothetical protein
MKKLLLDEPPITHNSDEVIAMPEGLGGNGGRLLPWIGHATEANRLVSLEEAGPYIRAQLKTDPVRTGGTKPR